MKAVPSALQAELVAKPKAFTLKKRNHKMLNPISTGQSIDAKNLPDRRKFIKTPKKNNSPELNELLEVSNLKGHTEPMYIHDTNSEIGEMRVVQC